MYPPIFELCSTNSRVTDVFGTVPCRIYPFGEAPQQTATPYAVWRIVNGQPENSLNTTPDMDSLTIMVDVFADGGEAARNGAEEIRDAIEGSCYVTTWLGETRDEKTRLYVSGFIADWFVDRFVISS